MIVTQCPRDSAIARALHGDDASWGLGEHLAAVLIDEVRVFRWSFSEDAAEGRTWTAPEPIPRPGVEAPERAGVTRLGDVALPIDDIRAALGMGESG